MKTLLLLLVAPALLLHQNTWETYGKTPAQILAMGHDKWYDFYVARAGETTIGMHNAEATYAEALEWRNARGLRRLPVATRSRLEKRMRLVRDYDQAIHALLSRGGGTMWVPVGAGMWVRREELFWTALGLQSRPPPRARSSAGLRRELAATQRDLDAVAAEIRVEPVAYFIDGAAGRKRSLATLARAKGVVRSLGVRVGQGRADEEALLVKYIRGRARDLREGPDG